MLENDYSDFEVWVSDDIKTIKIRSKTNLNLPVLIIGQYENYQHYEFRVQKAGKEVANGK